MKLVITLKSDLCVASGDGFSGSIDVDVVYDKNGIPFIPGKRLKGCLRSAAEEFLPAEVIDVIFGTAGGNAGCLRLGNAVIKDYEETAKYFESHGVDAQNVLSLFTYTRASTGINETGYAVEGSLRFMRVVSHFVGGEEMQFFADVQVDAEQRETFEKICRALRNIGYRRNRGLGAVRCELLDEPCEKVIKDLPPLSEDERYRAEYTVRLEGPVMLPANSGAGTDDYISGTAIMGFFASRLQNDDAFCDLFFKEDVVFSNLYPKTSTGQKCIPAPRIIGKDKLAVDERQAYANILTESTDRILKPLKNGFVDEDFVPCAAETEIIYHNSVKNQMIYTQNCLGAGQDFYGSIVASGKSLQKLLSALSDGRLQIGRSKTAQYGACKITELSVKRETSTSLKAEKGELLLYLLQSDVLLPTESGAYTADIRHLKDALGIEGEALPESSFSYKTVRGYNAKWNQKKPHLRAIEKGGCVVFRAEREEYPQTVLIGDRQKEGFGVARLYKASEITPTFKMAEQKEGTAAPPSLARLLSESGKDEEVKGEALNYALANREALTKLNPSFVSRVLNMVEQAADIIDLKTRVASVKDVRKRGIVSNVIESNSRFTQDPAWWKEFLKTVFIVIGYMIKQKGAVANDKDLL